MYTEKRALFLRCISPLHAGEGKDVGIIDMPIQRERHTQFPKVEASGVKGCIREEFEQLIKDNIIDDSEFVNTVFGPEKEGNLHAGAICFTDARILLFPVRSCIGVFAYATCPYVIRRFYEDLGIDDFSSITPNTVSGKGICKDGVAILEEYTFKVSVNEDTTKLARTIANYLGLTDTQKELLISNLIVLDNDDFVDFALHNTEIITRTKIDNATGTVAAGALFTEEFLPSESVLYSICMTSAVFKSASDKKNLKFLAKGEQNEANTIMSIFEDNIPSVIQLGGDATLGKGLIKVSLKEVSK